MYFGEIGEDPKTLKNYLARYGAPCPGTSNPAEHTSDAHSGSLSQGRDWHNIWLDSTEQKKRIKDLDHMIADAANKEPGTKGGGYGFAISIWEQTKASHPMRERWLLP